MIFRETVRTLTKGNSSYQTIIIEDYKLAYYALPKNASSSIKLWIMMLLGKQITQRIRLDVHSGWPLALTGYSYLPKELEYILETYFTFAFIRHPVTRLISGYYNKFYHPSGQVKPMAEEVIHIVGGPVDFERFVQYIEDTPDCDLNNHWSPQSTLFELDSVNYLGRVENFSDDFVAVQNYTGFYRRPPRKNVTRHRKYPEISPQLRSRIESRFSDDMTLWLGTAAHNRKAAGVFV